MSEGEPGSDDAPAEACGAEAGPRWYVYLLACGDGSLYTGVATDVARRLRVHQEGRGARYTRGRSPVSLVAVSPPLSRSSAQGLEHQVKRLPRERKAEAVRRAAVKPRRV